jgi:hypothetical protein
MDADDSPLGCCRREGQNGDITRSLDRRCHLSLMLRAVARNSAGDDFTPLGDEVSQNPRVLIVDIELLIGAESTYLSPDKRFSSGSLVFQWPAFFSSLLISNFVKSQVPGLTIHFLIGHDHLSGKISLSAVFHRRRWNAPRPKGWLC